MDAEISIHDNYVLSYTIDCEKQSITFRTVFHDNEPHEYTEIIFTKVAGYHFEGDNFQTILFDIYQSSPEEIYASHSELFERRKDYAWPFDYNTKQDLMEKLDKKSVKGFLISSSYGMDGFVLAAEMQITPSVKQD
jgi:hypothetical protein